MDDGHTGGPKLKCKGSRKDLGQTRLELAGAKTEVAELTKLAEERKVTIYGMAGDLEKARERDAAVWLPRLKEFGLRLEREPEAELVRPSWLDADVWERGVLPMVSPARGDRTFRAD
jgi:hypothetical protein